MEADFPTWEALHTHFPELCWLLYTHTQLIHALLFLVLSYYVGAIIVSPIFFSLIPIYFWGSIWNRLMAYIDDKLVQSQFCLLLLLLEIRSYRKT